MNQFVEKELFFKEGVNADSWRYLHPKLHKIHNIICQIADWADMDAVITDTIRPVGTIVGESGVHATGRAYDCVLRMKQYRKSVSVQNLMVMSRMITNFINHIFRRSDRYQTAIFHNRGLGWHIHVQVAADKNFKDLNGTIPTEDTYA